MFNEDSGLVKVWLKLIREERRTFTEVPDLSNLRTVVESVMSH